MIEQSLFETMMFSRPLIICALFFPYLLKQYFKETLSGKRKSLQNRK